MLLPGRYKGNRGKRWNYKPRTIDQIFGIDQLTEEEKKEMSHFGGRTEEAGAPILGAGFWKKGVQIKGTVTRSFKTDNGTCYVIRLNKAVKVDRRHTFPSANTTEELDRVSVGALKGFGMALQASGVPEGKLIAGDKVQISCTGTSPSGKGNDQINFDVQVDRGGSGRDEDIPF